MEYIQVIQPYLGKNHKPTTTIFIYYLFIYLQQYVIATRDRDRWSAIDILMCPHVI